MSPKKRRKNASRNDKRNRMRVWERQGLPNTYIARADADKVLKAMINLLIQYTDPQDRGAIKDAIHQRVAELDKIV